MKRLRTALMNRRDIVSGRIIVNILDKADPGGLVHSVAVAEIASIIGKFSGVGETGQSELWLAGLLHRNDCLCLYADIAAFTGIVCKEAPSDSPDGASRSGIRPPFPE